MKTIRRAFDMLKRNRRESWAYLLTLTLSASLLLVFINIQNDTNFLAQVTNISDPTLRLSSAVALGGITLLIAAVCAINCYVVNTYFLKAKAQELCVYLSCGMNIVALAKYLIIQNLMILTVALLLGAVLGILMNPLVNLIIYSVLDISGAFFTITGKGIFMWILILFFEIFYLFLLNIGYAYKAELRDLLDESRIVRIPDMRMIKLPVILYPILFILAFVGMFLAPANTIFYAICLMFAFTGIKGFFTSYLPKRHDKKSEKQKNLRCEKIILTGNIHAVIKNCFMYILMIFLLVVGMSCIMVNGLLLPYVRIILSVAYILLLVLMSASLFFKIMLEAAKRKIEFKQLDLIGLTQLSKQRILRNEIIQLFMYIILLPLPFSLLLCYRYSMAGQMELGMGVFLVCSFIAVFVVVGIASYIYYQKTGIEKRGAENE